MTPQTPAHICLRPDHVAVSVMSSLADLDLQAALVKSQREITELKDIMVKKFEDKSDNPRLGFCDFLKMKVVQLTRDSYDEFQQETFNLLMRLKRRDKQQQRNQHGMGMSLAHTVTYSQASTSLPLPAITQCLTHRCRHHITRCNRLLHTYRKGLHSSNFSSHSSTFNRQSLSGMH